MSKRVLTVSVCICDSSTDKSCQFHSKDDVFLVKMIYFVIFCHLCQSIFGKDRFFCGLRQCILMMEASILSMCRHTNDGNLLTDLTVSTKNTNGN